MDLIKLEKNLKDAGEPSFRLKQIREAYLKRLCGSWEEVSNIPKKLQEQLMNDIAWDALLEDALFNDNSGTVKVRLKTPDNFFIESVLIRHNDGRNTVCVSSQIGCPVACVFCATGDMGFKRGLTRYEIIEQVIYFARHLRYTPLSNGGKGDFKFDKFEKNRLHPSPLPRRQAGLLRKERENYEKVTNVVFMGMGEPLLNYEEVMGAIRELNDKDGFCLGARHISISTIGIIPGIKKLSKEKLQFNLAFSLHAPNDLLRKNIIPISSRYSIKSIFQAIDEYIELTNRRVMIEYLLISGVNDMEKNAKDLTELLKGRKLCFLNIIPYNTTGKFKKSDKSAEERFIGILEQSKIPYTVRHEFGSSVWAACGQLGGSKK
jgi:23S rRNA (adenine2503-C2)-methyltransferase